jgi:hypothetical protein
MPHQGNSPADIIGYDGQGKPIYKGHNNGNGVRRNGNGVRRNGNGNGNGNRNARMRNGRAATTPMRRNGNGRAANANPVTRLFNAPPSPRYYRPNGQIVPVGAPLHQHQDGTIMTEHSMGTNDNSQVVTTTIPRMNTNRRRATTRARTSGMMNQPARRTAVNRTNRRPVNRNRGGMSRGRTTSY